MKTMRLRNVGQIADANLVFGDLTVLVGPQASGKSITLQWIKLLQDTGLIQHQLDTYGLDYAGQLPALLNLYFGEVMHSMWRAGSDVQVDGKVVDVVKRVARATRNPSMAPSHPGLDWTTRLCALSPRRRHLRVSSIPVAYAPRQRLRACP